MKSFGLYINSHCDYDAGFPQWSPFIRYPYDQKNEERSPWSTETAESTIHSLSGLDTSVSLLTQAPLVDYRNLPRLALVRDIRHRWPLSLKTHLIRTLFGKSVGDCLDAIFSRSMKYPFFAQFEVSYSLE
ncbi:hypothetical protein JHK82_029646 [Glycine max]|nr:hypothetical protein JHK86_057241 [Glycine max]KAG4914364.1 hypothetical protein JHK87_051921 [Glycine soja]KAG4906014.1 hypothetical protein JHK86_057261 [Glycine max]KAG4906021.1 hypothetical protein JHK86_057268 [Glycine max]KAG4934590.1 hypothetical protein JHK85_049509 [Glycine max]